MKFTKLITLVALFSSEANGSISDWIFGDSDNGIVELDINVRPNISGHIPGHGSHLMSLVDETDDEGKKKYVEKALKNFYNIQIFSNIHFGSEKKAFPLIFDSGSSWVWVGHKLCDNCGAPEKFDSFNSKSYKQKSKHLSYLKYGRGMVFGYDSKDKVCLKPEEKSKSCMNDYLFKSVVL